MVDQEELPDDPFSDGPTDGTTGTARDGLPPAGGVGGGVMGRLFDGSVGGPSVDELRADYGLPREWSIALRGIVRVATGEGIPPAAEILMGSVMGMFKMDGLELPSGSDETDSQPDNENVAPGTQPPEP